MALNKPILQEDGVVTNYHRILSVKATVNSHNSIAVISYINEAARSCESSGEVMTPYRQGATFETDYDESMTPTKAYDYLKTLPEFEGATDI